MFVFLTLKKSLLDLNSPKHYEVPKKLPTPYLVPNPNVKGKVGGWGVSKPLQY